MQDKILILDFGSQVTQLIARRIRESGVYCEIHPYSMDEQQIRDFRPKAIVLSGGPASVQQSFSPKPSTAVYELGVPVLGICYGQQIMCAQLGGKIETAKSREFGRAFLKVIKPGGLFPEGWKPGHTEQVWMSHGDRIIVLPPGFAAQGGTEGAPYAVIADEKRKLYGVMFHPEVVHTTHGAAMIRRFTHDIAGCKGDWSMATFRHMAIQKVREQVGKKNVLCAVSGGVDSTVVAVLLHEAIRDQLRCIFVNTGMLRTGEVEEVRALFQKHFNIPLIYVDASRLFMAKLSGVKDPERKRKIIGETFIDVFEHEAEKAGGAEFLAQGTLYPDVVESVSVHGGPSSTIKSHHNVGGLPERMHMKLVEPVRELFKDEVRALGMELGIPKEFVTRHPFPGPGLAIRIPGDVTPEKVELLTQADKIFIEEIRNAKLYDSIWQAFAVLLPVKSVGVMGDARTYEYVCALRAVTSVDGMTADYYPFDHQFLGKVSTRIINEVKGINRIVYDVTSKPPGTIEWE